MIPFLPFILTGAAAWGAKKIYDAVTEDSGSSSSSSYSYSDNSAERARQARHAEEQRRQQEREQRQFQQLQQTLHTELRGLRNEYLHQSVTVNTPSETQIQRFMDFEIEQPAAAKAALGQLLGASVQLKELPNQIAANKKRIKGLNELEQLVRGL